MSFRIAYTLDNFFQKIKDFQAANDLADPEIAKDIEKYIEKLLIKLQKHDFSCHDFTAFWPPRCVDALKRQEVVIFFGAGVSSSCGLPGWRELLSETFGLDKSLTEDKDLENDPLTLAELASQYLGSEVLQSILRREMKKPDRFSLSHAALAALRCPIYITTNYDCLFEQAWRKVNPTSLIVVTNDAWMLTKDYSEAEANGNSILFKIHGCVKKSEDENEYLILTRHDYRFHYRTNKKMFDAVKKLLREKHILFVGFSHKDPEVSRLVEDAIYDYEKEKAKANSAIIDPRPQFYSLQFGMSSHTPEIFAARGIVALQPPPIMTALSNVKSTALAVALTDLIGAKQHDLHSKVTLDQKLRETIEILSKEITDAINTLDKFGDNAKQSLTKFSSSNSWLDNLIEELSNIGNLASQGVYLLDDQGNTIEHRVPHGLNQALRKPSIPLNNRPYFRQAKSFRESFISDSSGSIFNGQSTFFICKPVVKNGQSIGLLFSAVQIGQWKTPYEKAKELWKTFSFLLIDSNGVCLVPPRGEFDIVPAEKMIQGESPAANIGFSYSRLLELSRRDDLVRHISKSVVPITQDDDVLELGRDLKEFSVVSELPRTRWKIAISFPVHVKTE